LVHRTLAALIIASLLGLSACAGSTAGSATSRAFERPELERLPLQTLSVWVVSKPPVENEGSLDDVDAFGPPGLDETLSPKRVDPLMQRALLDRIEAWGRAQGFEVKPARAPTARPTLRELLGAAETDAVLIVRVVPVDRFTVFEKAGEQQIIDTGDPATQMLTTAEAAEDRLGRLLVGQAFLYEPTSRVRLWSRQIPDFPTAGRLTPDDPFLAYGYVAEDVDEVTDLAEKAERAADAFVPAMLDTFPGPESGDPEVRAALRSASFQRQARMQRFLDQNHVALEISAGWEMPSIRSRARTLQDVGQLEPVEIALPELGTGELAPVGSFELRPKAIWIRPGGLSFSAGFELGFIPNDFQRTVFVENVDDVGDFDQAVELSVSGGTTVGGSLAGGWLVPLSPALFLHPEVGTFVDVYLFDASPTVPDATHVTWGGQGELSVWLRPSATGALYLRAGAGGRVGADFGGDVLASFVASVGVGWLD
jgi:hypothetical protein